MDKPHNFYWVESLQVRQEESRLKMREYEVWMNLGLNYEMQKQNILSSKLFFIGRPYLMKLYIIALIRK